MISDYQPRTSRRRFLKTLVLAGAAAAVDWACLGSMASAVASRESAPVVVIGSGLGGLVAAAFLAKQGFPVTVLEQHSIPGGYATSFERDGGDFVFDVSLHATVAEHAIPQKILSDLGVWDRLEVVKVPELARLITPVHDITLPAGNPGEVMKILGRHFPGEQAGINGFISDMVTVHGFLRGANRHGGSLMEKLEVMSLSQWLDGHVSGPDVREYLSVLCGYYGQAPAQLNALFYAIATGEYLVSGGNYYKTRSQSLSNALVECIERYNGKVLFNTEASAISVSAGDGAGTSRVTGVIDGSGRAYPAAAVIANAGAPVVFSRLLPQSAVPAAFRQRLAGLSPSLSSFVVWLGIDRELSSVEGYEIFLNGHGDRESRFEIARSGDPAEADISLTVYDNLYKGYSRPGTSTLTIMSLAGYSHWKPFEADYAAGRKQAYEKEKFRIADAFIRRIETRLIPGLSGMIRVMEVGTPLTNQRFTRNPGGAIYGFEDTGSRTGCRTPVQGLYLAGAWSHGGGYTPAMMAGHEAASMAVRGMGTKR